MAKEAEYDYPEQIKKPNLARNNLKVRTFTNTKDQCKVANSIVLIWL